MDAPVAARSDNSSSATVYTTADALLKIAYALTQVNLEGKAALAEQLTYACPALAGAAATRGRIEEKVDGLDRH